MDRDDYYDFAEPERFEDERNWSRMYNDDIYAEELDWREKEWDEPGPDFGSTILRNRRTGAVAFVPYEEV